MRAITLHLSSRAADVERWSRGEIAGEVVKENSGRTIWRVPAGAPALYVKRFPRELLRDRARKEAGMLQALEKAGIPCPRLVATARDREGSYILTEEIAPAAILQQELAQPGSRPLLAALGLLARRLHDAGFEHLDFHAGNILVKGRELFVLDVHRARRGKALSRARRLDGVAFMAMSFSELLPLTDLLRFFRAYGLGKRECLSAWDRLRRLRDRYYRGRTERCFKEGTGFGVKGRLMFRKGADLEGVLRAVGARDSVLVKEKGSESLRRLGPIFVKRSKRARSIWRNGHGFEVRHIDTPRLHAWGGPWVAGEWIEAPDLYACVREKFPRMGRAARDGFLSRLARAVRRMHDRGVFHADLKAANVIVTEAKFHIVDLDRVRFSLDVAEKDRIFNLAQLNASVTPPLTRTDRLRALRYYFGRCRPTSEPRWVREIMRVTIARAHHWPERTP